MTVSLKILLASFTLASAGSAYADCAAELARLENGTSASTAEGIAKDGSTAPLEDAGDSVPDQAMSAQDAQSQQEGDPTAAAQADHPGANDRAAALSEARRALEAGNEAACLEALEGMTVS